jgi:hypothetical protein
VDLEACNSSSAAALLAATQAIPSIVYNTRWAQPGLHILAIDSRAVECCLDMSF